ncbi:MAG TPA: hypothetical protein DCG33_07420 [Prevotellaceae bacterium]|jgi:predicted phosphodiesterase|nr:hypothetical protein [Prevotellaceae bacterium]
MDRRTFLQHSVVLSGAFCLDFPAFARKIKSFGKPRLKIGIVSDIHIRDIKSASTFEHTLEYFRSQNVDGVIIAGDIADYGFESQFANAAEKWYKVFPNDLAPDGHIVEKLFVYGNHDLEGHNYGFVKKAHPDGAYREKEKISGRQAEIWEKYLHEKWEPIQLKQVNGYYFICGHYQNRKNMPGLDKFLERHHDKLVNKKKPFFYIQHTHPKDTCSSPYVWGQDGGEVTKLLSAYPNAVSFSGHSHTPLTDDRTIWQGAFTSVGTASLSYVFPIGARENSEVFRVKEKVPAQMPVMDYYKGKHGMLMTVYEDYITLERREFIHDELLGDNWIIPLPHSTADAPLSFENRAQKASVPQFGANAKVTVTRGTGKSRNKEEKKQIIAHFPSVLKKTTGVRAFDYEVQAEIRDEDVSKVMMTKRIFSPGSIMGENHDEEEVTCIFAEDEIPYKAPIRFVVRPCECFGKKGNPIYSEWIENN